MLKVGLTGGIGSGKSTIGRVIELLGISVYYSDLESKKILTESEEVKIEVLKLFGETILNDENSIDKKKLGQLVFNDSNKLQKLNSIIHPAVGMHFKTWCDKHSSEKYILKEAAILFESNVYKQMDKIITVTSPIEMKIKRAMLRDKLTKNEVEQRMKNQLTDEEKISKSNYVIINNEEQFIIPQIINLHKILIEEK